MARYVWTYLPLPSLDESFDPGGEVIDYRPKDEIPFSQDHAYLVRLPAGGEVEDIRSAVNDDTSDLIQDEDPTCAGKDGECSRTVDEPGEKCWQHEDDD